MNGMTQDTTLFMYYKTLHISVFSHPAIFRCYFKIHINITTYEMQFNGNASVDRYSYIIFIANKIFTAVLLSLIKIKLTVLQVMCIPCLIKPRKNNAHALIQALTLIYCYNLFRALPHSLRTECPVPV